MKIIHVQTTIQTVFGVLDADGNVIPQEPVQAQVQVFSASAFGEAFEAIKRVRDETLANSPDEATANDGGTASQGKAAANGNRAQRRASARTKPARAS